MRGAKQCNTWAASKKIVQVHWPQGDKRRRNYLNHVNEDQCCDLRGCLGVKVLWQLVISNVSIFLNLGQIIYLFVTTQDKVLSV